MPNRNKDTIDNDFRVIGCGDNQLVGIGQFGNLFQIRIKQTFDIFAFGHAVAQYGFGAGERPLAINDFHGLGNVGQIQRIVQRTVATAQNDDRFVRIEKSVACRTVRYTLAHQFARAFDFQFARRCAGGHDNGFTNVSFAVVAHDVKSTFRVTRNGFGGHEYDFRTECFGLFLHEFGQFQPTAGPTGIVFQNRNPRGLAPQTITAQDQCFFVRARAVQRRRQPRRART